MLHQVISDGHQNKFVASIEKDSFEILRVQRTT